MYSNNDYRSYELYHHGILGQKWGHQNGPPYPLDESDHSTSEKKAGWHKSLDGGSDSSGKRRAPESVAQRKKRIMTGVKEAHKADKLDEKGFKAIEKGKYDKANKYFSKSKAINELAQAKLADASFEEIELGGQFLKERKAMTIAAVAGTILGGPVAGAASAAGTYAFNAVSREGKLARQMQKDIDRENQAKYLKEKEKYKQNK